MKVTASDNATFNVPFAALKLPGFSLENLVIAWFFITPVASFYIRFPVEKSLITFDRLVFFSIALVLTAKQYISKKDRPAFTATGFEIAWALLSLVALISAIGQSNNAGYAIKIAVDAFLLPLIAYRVARRHFRLEGHESSLLLAAIALAIFLFLTGAYEFATGANLFAYKGSEVLREGERRVNGPFASDSSFAIISLLLVLFLRIAPRLFKIKFDKSARLIYFCALVASAVSTLLPLFRAAAFALVLCLAIIEILLHARGRSVFQTLFSARFFRSRRLKLYAALILLVVLPAGVLLEMQRSSSIFRRLSSPRNLYARLATWQTAAKIVYENPLFGVGLTNYSDYFDKKFSDWREQRDFVEGAKAVDTPHSNFLWIASELGLIGLVLYLLAYFCLLQTGFRIFKRARDEGQRLLSGFFLVLVLAYTLPALTLQSGAYSDLNLYFFFLLGIASKNSFDVSRNRI